MLTERANRRYKFAGIIFAGGIWLFIAVQHLITDFGETSLNPVGKKVVELQKDQVGSVFIESSIAKMNWFGTPPEDADSGKNSILSDRFELKGISQSPDHLVAGAFIAKKGLQEKFYRIGETLPDNAGDLSAIFADHVSVKSGDRILDLYFDGGSPVSGIKDKAENAGRTSPFTFLPPEPISNSKMPPPAELARQFIDQPEQLLAQAGLESVTPGQEAGYRFSGTDVQGVFANTGIRAGDVIRRIDNAPVGDPKADRLLLPKLMNAKILDFDVQRGTEHFIFHYSVP